MAAVADAGHAVLRGAMRRVIDVDDARHAAAVLRPLFTDLAWLDALVAGNLAEMTADAMMLPPFSATCNGALAHLVLVANPVAMVAVSRIGGAAEQSPGQAMARPRVCFTGQQSLWRLLSADPLPARLARLSADGARCRSRAVLLRPDRVTMLDERRHSLWLAPPPRPAWLLRARIHRRPAPLMRTVMLDDGTSVGAVQGDDAFGRAIMLLGVQRMLGPADAFNAGLGLLERARGMDRWTVLRELTAIDAGRARHHLALLADDTAMPMAARTAARQVLERIALAAAPIAPQSHGTAQPCLA